MSLLKGYVSVDETTLKESYSLLVPPQPNTRALSQRRLKSWTAWKIWIRNVHRSNRRTIVAPSFFAAIAACYLSGKPVGDLGPTRCHRSHPHRGAHPAAKTNTFITSHKAFDLPTRDVVTASLIRGQAKTSEHLQRALGNLISEADGTSCLLD